MVVAAVSSSTIGPQRPHVSVTTTARFGHNDRTFRSQRLHDPAAMTARFFQTKGGSVRNEKSLHHEGDTDFSIFFVHPQGFEPWTH